MFRWLTWLVVFLIAALPICAQKTPIRDVAKQSDELTALTAPSSVPFHLLAALSTGSGGQGSFEEYWVSATKWRRIIRTPEFSQTTIVNGDTYYEKNEGDYFPPALRVLTGALLQPVPDRLQTALSRSKAALTFYPGLKHASICDAGQVKTGTPPAQNEVFIRVCFAGDPATVSTIVMPGYSVEFKDRQPFGKLFIARSLVSDSSPETKWQAQITQLERITAPDETLFAAPEQTPIEQRFQVVQVSEDQARQVFKNLPVLVWPAVHSGKTKGVLSLYVSLDRSHKVREVWPLNSDNPEISDAACEQIKNWKFGTGDPQKFVQLETIFTFAFDTQKAPQAADQK